MAIIDEANQWPAYMPPREAWAEPFWSALSEGRLMLQVCDQCHLSIYPATEAHCTACGSSLSWVTASGQARLWSWVTFHREYYPGYPLPPPYTVVMAELPEGVRMLATLVTEALPENLQFECELLFAPIELAPGVFIPGFRPLS